MCVSTMLSVDGGVGRRRYCSPGVVLGLLFLPICGFS